MVYWPTMTSSHQTVSRGEILLQDLNPQQREAARTVDGPVLILAGAGSGKTKTIVHRMAYMMIDHNINPWNILGVTFTNKAAQNMRERMSTLMKKAGQNTTTAPLLGTFHSICVKLLRKEYEAAGLPTDFVIYNSDDQATLIKRLLKEGGYDTHKVTPSSVHWRISAAKNQLVTPEVFAQSVDDTLGEVAAEIYPKYQDQLQKHHAVDFDDLIMKVVHLFQTREDVLKKYQDLWTHIVVDEYQDTNQAQYMLVSLIAQKHHNICVVGDDYQSIYSWRQADIRNILEFERDYPEAKVVLLEQNYRSTQTILNAANAVIAKNKGQKKKILWTENVEGKKLVISEVSSEEAESEAVVKIIAGKDEAVNEKLSDDGITYDTSDSQLDEEEAPHQNESLLDRIMRSKMFAAHKDNEQLRAYIQNNKKTIDFSRFVVLYRTNAQSRSVEEAFLQYNIPYKLVGGLKFYERREIKDALAYLRSVCNFNDWVSLERIVNAPTRGLGKTTWSKIERFAIDHGFSVVEAASHVIPDVQDARLKSFYQFAEMMNQLRNEITEMSPTQAIDYIMHHSGYRAFILNESETKELGETRWENIQELRSVSEKFRELRGVAGLEALLEDVALVSDQDDVDESQNAVTLMTIHAAKGLEYPVVIVVGMEEGIFPHARSLMDPKEMEEERRLCYVAITRAMKQAYLLFASQRLRYGNTQVNPPSRFIDDIPKELLAWKNL